MFPPEHQRAESGDTEDRGEDEVRAENMFGRRGHDVSTEDHRDHRNGRADDPEELKAVGRVR